MKKLSSTDNKELVKEARKIDSSTALDINKVEEIIMKKLPKGIITNLGFKNNFNNPHYCVSVLSEGVKYEVEVLLKDSSINKIKREKVEIK